MAARIGDLNMLKKMERGGFFQWQEPSIISSAVQTPFIDVIAFLASKGVSLNGKVVSRRSGQRNSRRRYSDEDEDEKFAPVENLLHIATEGGCPSAVKYLVEHGANVKGKDKDDQTVLQIAVQKGFCDLVTFYVKRGLDINQQSSSGRNFLFDAVDKADYNLVKCLIKNGADANAKDDQEHEIVLYAANKKQLEMVKLLMESGAKREDVLKKVMEKDDSGKTVFQQVLTRGDLDEINCYLE